MLLRSLLRCCFLSNFGVSAPSLDPTGLHFGSIWAPFWLHLGFILAPFGLHLLPSTGWWEYAKRAEFAIHFALCLAMSTDNLFRLLYQL